MKRKKITLYFIGFVLSHSFGFAVSSKPLNASCHVFLRVPVMIHETVMRVMQMKQSTLERSRLASRTTLSWGESGCEAQLRND